ncbi:glucose-1-phosphate adenylyltransferase [Janibacter sp. GS2]|uniref:glucose-1-phosphate adenylyltransferase n=1 Tax=Janibacter sp. GS2 TaxID=3442646 RepID=UPI003EBDF584
MAGRGQPRVLTVVLAGGEGKRLMPLTADRAKPAVPFGGIYRLVDFALSNVVNSGYAKIIVLTQYKSHSLDRHVSQAWRMASPLGHYVAPVPAQQRRGKSWYTGSADAIYQSFNAITDERPEVVVVVGADHVYRMDFSDMVAQHLDTGAECTVAAIRQPIDTADQFGVMEVAEDGRRIRAFREKPTDPRGLPDAPQEIYASMGNYVFSTEALMEAVRSDARDDSAHDMGGDIVPAFVARGTAHAYDFADTTVPGASDRDRGYWRDVGTIDSYFDAHLDLTSVVPVFNLYNYDWPINTNHGPYPPAKFVHADGERAGGATNSIVSPGVVVSGGHVDNSVLSPGVFVHSYSTVRDCVLLDGVDVGRHCELERVIVDKGVRIPAGMRLGVDREEDLSRGLQVSESGITVVGKGHVFDAS